MRNVIDSTTAKTLRKTAFLMGNEQKRREVRRHGNVGANKGRKKKVLQSTTQSNEAVGRSTGEGPAISTVLPAT